MVNVKETGTVYLTLHDGAVGITHTCGPTPGVSQSLCQGQNTG